MSDEGGNPLQRLPLPVFFIVVAGLWIAIQLIFAHRVDTVSVIITVAGGLVFAAVTTGGLVIRRRRAGGADSYAAYGRALRTGVVPSGADTSHWGAALDATERRTRRYRWLLPALGVVPVGLGIAVAFEPDARVVGLATAVLFVAAIVLAEVLVPRDLAKVDRLRAALDAP